MYDICRVQTADCRLQMSYTAYRAPRFIRVLLTMFHVPGGIRPIMTHTGKLPPESDTFFSFRISFIWNGEWRNEFPEDHCRYTRGILLPEHAPGARSGSTLREQISSVCTNDFMGTIHPREQNQWPAPVGPLAQLVRALHRYRVDHGLNPGKPGHFRAFFS